MGEYTHCPLCGMAIDISYRGGDRRNDAYMQHMNEHHPTGR